MVPVNPLLLDFEPARAPQLSKEKKVKELYFISALGLISSPFQDEVCFSCEVDDIS